MLTAPSPCQHLLGLQDNFGDIQSSAWGRTVPARRHGNTAQPCYQTPAKPHRGAPDPRRPLGFNSPVFQVVAVDPDLGENGTVVYSIRPPNKFYSLNSTSGKIRTSGVLLDRENPNPQEAELMRRIVVSVTDCECEDAGVEGRDRARWSLGPGT